MSQQILQNTNGEDQNNKRRRIYETKLRHLIVGGPN